MSRQASPAPDAPQGLKHQTAGVIKWNTIDRVTSQLVYAVVGVVLANILSKEDFGLVGAILVFQAFAILFVDSGFGAALLQQKEPGEKDYSTVFWFNLGVAIAVYWVLFFCAPAISDLFQHDRRLIPMSRVMFLTFVLNGLGIVQTNRLMKRMDVKQMAVANVAGLVLSGGLGVFLALKGHGAWALVWQSVTLAAVKTGWLWMVCRWLPSLVFSLESMKKIWRVGLGVFSSSFLNTVFLNVYNIVIGACYNLASLGVYTQADKWSKMGTASLSQIFTSSFVPLLSKVQDNAGEFHRYMGKINRFAAFLLFPVMLGLTLIAEPLFHTLFGNKWDAAIPLFQLLCLRGIPVVLVSLYGNFLLSLGHAKSLVMIEVVKDVLTAAAILATVFLDSVFWLVAGQLGASLLAFAYVWRLTCRNTGYRALQFVRDNIPYAGITLASLAIAWFAASFVRTPWITLTIEIACATVCYIAILKISGSTMLNDALAYIKKR